MKVFPVFILLLIAVSFGAEPPLMQSKVKGLLVVDLGNGSFAGTASQMNATVVPAADKDMFRLQFNQKVGKMMSDKDVQEELLDN